jgi:FAD:protein FMN transferase
MRRTAHIMGMPVSVEIPGQVKPKIFEQVFANLAEVGERFSPFKPESELLRYRAGDVSENELSREMKQVMAACKQAEKDTGGYFSAYHSGVFDPTGYVKGWAIGRAGKLLKGLGHRTFCLSVGGDILASSGSDKVWQIGIQDPKRSRYLTSQVSIANGAVVTSGTYERGEHVINPKTKKANKTLVSVTVIGPDVITADILATAQLASGQTNLALIEKKPGYEAMAIDRADNLLMSTGISRFSRSQGSNQL